MNVNQMVKRFSHSQNIVIRKLNAISFRKSEVVFEMNYNWVPTTLYAPIPINAVLGGHDSDGSRIYIGRTYFQGDQIPCKIIPSKQAAYLSYNGIEHFVTTYIEILCGYGLRWISASHGGIPHGAVPAGYSRSGDTYFVGRAHFLGGLTPGRVSRTHRCLYVPYGGREYAVPIYEVLVNSPSLNLNLNLNKNSCSIQ